MKQTELAKSLSVVWHPHPVMPFAGREVMMVAAEGYTIRQLLLNAQVDPYQELVVYVDDKLITVEEWDTLRPTDGQLVNVQAVVSGGGGNGESNPLQIVAQIALIVVATALFGPGGTYAATLGTVGSAIAMATVMVAGSLLMGAIFKPSGISATDAYEQASPTYSLSGAQNRARPYESMPVVMGTHRVVFDYASRPYTEYKGEDQYLYQIFHGGVSPTRYSDFKIGTNPISNYADLNLYYPSDSTGSLKDFPGNVDSIAGAPLTAAAGWITRTTSANTYQIGVDIEAVLAQANDEGGIDPTTVEIQIEYKATGSATWLTPSQIISSRTDIAAGSIQTITETQDQGYWDINWEGTGTGDWVENLVTVTKDVFVAGAGGIVQLTAGSQTPRRVSLTFAVAEGAYDVRVKRNTADSTDPQLTNNTNWSILKSYQVDNTNYTGQTRIGMSIRASEQLNGTVAQFNALGESDALYWNGTAFVIAPSSNPAHLFTHFALGSYNADGKLMFGVGLPSSQLDLASLHAWATFCTAEGLTFNAVIDGNQTAADVLNAIARCGLGSPTWASGKLGAVWDYRNSSPVASFGMSNIIRDSFEVAYINENLAEEIVVRFRNPDKDWEQDEVRVLAPTITDPKRTSAIDLFGCTNATMAGKFANYLAAQQYYRRRRISWESDFEGFVCQRGDTVLLSHDLTQWGYSGRIVSVAGLTITLDRAVPRSGVAEYLMITRPDGTMTTYTTTAETGEDSTITLTTFPSLQEGYDLMDHRWSFSPLATPGKKVKILSIDPVSDSRLRITATDEFAEFYDAWNGTFVAPPDLTLLPQAVVEANNLTVTSRIAIVNGYRTNRVTASWGVGGGVLYSRVRAYFDGNLIIENAQSLVQFFEHDVYEAGTFLIEVTPFGIFGAGETITSTLELAGLAAPEPPASVTLTVGNNGKSQTFTWDSVPGVQSYVIDIVVSGTSRRTVNVGNTLTYTYTLDDAIADGGAVREYDFRVYSVGNGIQSLTYAQAQFSNPQIGALVNARIEPMPNSLWFRCDLPTEPDFAAIRIWISKTSGFSPSALTVAYDGGDNWVNIAADTDGNPLESGVIYYVRAAGYDTYGDDNLTTTGEFSTTILSPAWGLIQGDIDETLLEAGLRDRIDLIDRITVEDIDATLIPAQTGLISIVRNLSTEVADVSDNTDLIGQKLLESTLKVQENTDLLYDAGLTVDSTTGEVYIYGVRENANELNTVDIRLSAAEANILLRATTTYVDEQIATAVIDPSQIVELGALTARVTAAEVEIDGLDAAVTLKADILTVDAQGARLTTAEADIDALEGEIVLKADNTDLTATDARVTTVESTLSVLDIPAITQSVQDVRYISKNQDQIAETQLRDILTGQANYDDLEVSVARAEQRLTAYTDGLTLAEATARLLLEAELGETQAALEQESIARATGDEAEASARLALSAVVDQNAADIVTESIARADADSALSTQITTLQATTASNTALITAETTARTDADTAFTNQLVILSAEVDDNIAAVVAEATARADADTALSNTISALTATVGTNTAAIATEATTRADADTALSTLITNLEAVVDDNTAAISTEATTRASADTALSSSITTLQTTVNGHTTSIQTNATSIDGIQAKYTVKIDNNGYISGYGLISTNNNATPTAEFTVIADRFSLAPVATNPTAVDGSPFFVLTAPQVIGGVTIPSGSYMKAAFIHDATITTAKIANAAITEAKILNASISSAKIANTIQSDNYTSTTGWQINKAGTMTLNQANVRGQINLGAYTAYAWPPSGNGIHLSQEGMLAGNANTGQYFQIYTPPGGTGAFIYTNIPISAMNANLGNMTAGSLSVGNSSQGLFVNSPSYGNAVYAFQNAQFTYGLYAKNSWASNNGGGAANFESNYGFTLNSGLQVNAASPNPSAKNCAIAASGATGGGVAFIATSGANGGYAGYAAAGSWSPFTGSHDGLIAIGTEIEVGDIVIDSQIVATKVSDSLTIVTRSSAPNQKGALGIFVSQRPLLHGVPAALMEGGVITDQAYIDELAEDYDNTVINSVGEGAVNVCGEGGNIEIGDLIVTSSMAGKGMKQADDLVRSSTVARAREAYTFTDPTEVKLIACIYVCG